MSRWVAAVLACGAALVPAASARADLNPPTSLISAAADGSAGGLGGSTDAPTISADGHLVAFSSASPALGPGGASEVLVRDLRAHTTSGVSVAPDGATPGDAPSVGPRMTPDGRWVVFTSMASNLAPGAGPGVDVFARDLVAGRTVLVSRGINGAPADGSSADPAISDDGRFVAFSSTATNLVSGDDNGRADVFVFDLRLLRSTLVSENVFAQRGGNGDSSRPVISADGRFVAFESLASDLAAGDQNSVSDVFQRDMRSATTALVSTNGLRAGAGASRAPRMSRDGRVVAFVSKAPDLQPGVSDTNGADDVFVRDRVANATALVSVSAAGGAAAAGPSTDPVLSPDGRSLAFTSTAANIVGGDANGAADAFVRDLSAQTTTLASVNGAGTGSGTGASSAVSWSGDGRLLALVSSAADLTANDGNSGSDVFLRDLDTSRTELVSLNSGGTGAGAGTSDRPAVAGDGRSVAFASTAADLAGAGSDVNGDADVYVRGNRAPRAAFSIAAGSRSAPVVVRFDGTASSDPDGSVTAATWSFGDGTTGHGLRPVHRFATAGRYVVTLTVLDDDGLPDTDPRTLVISGCTVTGTNRAEILRGTARRDVICGMGGGDRILGLGGDDVISAGTGNDRVDGGSGRDRITGGVGADTLSGGSGADRLFGEDGGDRLYGGTGDDRLDGGAGGDRLIGGSGRDVLVGGSGRDLLLAFDGVADRLFGGSGRDAGHADRRRDRASSVEALALAPRR